MNDAIITTNNAPLSTTVHAQTDACTDEQLIELWLHTGKRRSEHTRTAYRANVERFLVFVGKPLRQLKLEDLVDFQQELAGSEYAASTQRRILSAVRSLLTFGQKVGYLPFNVGAALELPEGDNQLAQRILSEEQVLRMIALEKNRRNQLVIRLLYAAGLRVSELCGLRWLHCQAREQEGSGQISVKGKGNKTRQILLRKETWEALLVLRGQAGAEKPVFRSRKGGALSRTQVFRIVKTAGKRAGLGDGVSPHWLRHAHASHALERGAPISLVKSTLGHSNISVTDRYTHARPEDSSARYLPV